MPNALFFHNGSPGRFDFIARALVERGWVSKLINGPKGRDIEGVETSRWTPPAGTPEGARSPLQRIESEIVYGCCAAEAAQALRDSGFTPDVIIGHPGWGEMLFLRDIFPDVRQIQIAEYFYHARGADVGFDPEFSSPMTVQKVAATESKNFTMAASYAHADCLVAPTPFQASLLPLALRPRARILHEGIDTAVAKRRPASLSFASGVTIDGSAPLITFINRHFEPMRGVHIFMRALPAVLEEVPDARVIMIGSDAPEGYGPPPPKGETWLKRFKTELGSRIDYSRVHTPGQVGYETLLDVLSLSSAHVYWTYPFVLSWSLLDAMSCEALVVASDTAPVRDVVRHGENGLMVDFFDVGGLSRSLIEACREPQRFQPLRKAARDTVVSQYDRASINLPAWLALIDEMAGRG
jgi:glycosyltransferase involved in cell wall biosynthesis